MNAPKINVLWRLMRFDKPIGILLLAWPTCWALWLASAGHPDTSIVLIFILGTILMRAAGCVINDVLDRHIDVHVKRTQQRPLANQEISLNMAIGVFLLLCFLAFCLTWWLNLLVIKLAIVGFFLTSLYPLMKRFTQLPQGFLGLTFAWGIPMAYAAVQNRIPPHAWYLFAATVLWIIAYDTQYAMVDRDDDLKIGVKSSAILFGKYDRIIIFILQSLFLGILVSLGFANHFHLSYYIGLLLAAMLMVHQQRLIRFRQPDMCFQAFLNNQWVGLVIMLGIMIGLHFHI